VRLIERSAQFWGSEFPSILDILEIHWIFVSNKEGFGQIAKSLFVAYRVQQ
jgi:hypothetical protein